MSIINTALIGKLKKTKADKTNVLELNQTTAFTPTADYHPATKKYVDENGGGGTVNNVFGGRKTEDFTATAGQTEFDITIGFDDIEVFYNGIKLDEEDYTIDENANTLTLLEACEVDDNIEVINYYFADTFTTAYEKSSYTVGTASGDYDGDLADFPCTYSIDPVLVEVFLNGLKLTEEEYTATSGTSISLLADAESGDAIEIIGYTQVDNDHYYNKTEIDDLILKDDTTTSGTTEQVVDTFDKTEYFSGEYLININDGTSSNTQKIVIQQDGTNAELVTYANLGTDLGTFDVQINGSNLELLFTPTSASCTLKFKRELI